MHFSFNPYIAIIGDIKKSKQINDRRTVQMELISILSEINQRYSDDLASRFMITLGDEFQGLLNHGDNIMNIIYEIESKMYPVEIRFGIGVGEITTDIDAEFPLGADGPAYYNARYAIELLKSSEKRNKVAKSNILIRLNEENEVSENMLNTILSLLTVIKNKWSDRQREVVNDYISHRDSQVKVANRLGITQSSVQKNLSNADYYSFKEAVDVVSCALSEIRRRENV